MEHVYSNDLGPHTPHMMYAAKEKPPHTRQRPLTLAAFLPWGSWVT